MRKKITPVFYWLTVGTIWCTSILSACQTSRFAQNTNPTQQNQVTTSLSTVPPSDSQENQLMVAVSTDQEEPAAAETRPELDLFMHRSDIIRAPVAKTMAKTETQKTNVSVQSLNKKMSLPARMLMKHIAKKAEKLQKKDITDTTQQKEVNNKSYLILGIVLLAAGLVLVLVGNTTLLYILGSVASLAGLVFLLLAIL